VSHCTAVVEDFDGKLSLIWWDRHAESEGMGTLWATQDSTIDPVEAR
jgi:hypothetical protein